MVPAALSPSSFSTDFSAEKGSSKLLQASARACDGTLKSSTCNKSRDDLHAGLKAVPKRIPCDFLYDSKGSALYEEITELEEYYLFREEMRLLKLHARDIIKHIPKGSILVELGCGSAVKTAILQSALLKRDGTENCTFVGIDVSQDFLKQAKENMLKACQGLTAERIELVQATYLEGLRKVRTRHPDDVLCILWLGSSAGNMAPEEGQRFFQDILRICGPKTEVLLCTDLWKDNRILHAAYCDKQGVTEAFIKNGMANALAAAFDSNHRVKVDEWIYHVNVNDEHKQVEMYLTVKRSFDIGKMYHFKEGEDVLIEVSRKFTAEHMRCLAHTAGYFFQAQWKSQAYSIQMFCAPLLAFELAWHDTDLLFNMVSDLYATPIQLRHPFCFYYGHNAAFSKIKLLKDQPVSEWDLMFSRGMDPDVAEPEKCHSHPEQPDTWPSCEDLKAYVSRAREVMQDRLRSCSASMQILCMCLEHERMHQETLCYMLVQQQKRRWEQEHSQSQSYIQTSMPVTDETLSKIGGKGWPVLPWSSADMHDDSLLKSCEWVTVDGGEVRLGAQVNGQSGFVWDNEGPIQEPEFVSGFQASTCPVSIAQFREFVLKHNGYNNPAFWKNSDFAVIKAAKQQCPATWTLTADGEVWVHRPGATYNWARIQDWPVWCSQAEANAFCKFKGCRLMTELEYNLAVQNDPTGSMIAELQHGGWEWTSTPFAPFKGFLAMDAYKEYSTDFFDDKHFVLKGSCPYTHPSMQRSSFRNFYQGIYPHVFAKFRCIQ